MALLIGRGGSDVRVGQVRMAHLSHRISEDALRTGKGAVQVEILRVCGTMATVRVNKTGMILRIDTRGVRPMAKAKQEALVLDELKAKFSNKPE